MIGEVLQSAWFGLVLYFNAMLGLDIVRPRVFLEGAPVVPILRLVVYCFTLCLAICTAPAILPCGGLKAAVIKRCKVFQSRRATAVVMTLLMKLMVGRAYQFDFALPGDVDNVAWGWLIVLIVFFALIEIIVLILQSIVWVLMGCPGKQSESKKGKKDA